MGNTQSITPFQRPEHFTRCYELRNGGITIDRSPLYPSCSHSLIPLAQPSPLSASVLSQDLNRYRDQNKQSTKETNVNTDVCFLSVARAHRERGGTDRLPGGVVHSLSPRAMAHIDYTLVSILVSIDG